MIYKNRYYKFSKISEAKFRSLVRCFALDLNATDSAVMTDLSVRSVNEIFLKVRGRIASYCEELSPYANDIEIDKTTAIKQPMYNRHNCDCDIGNNIIIFGIVEKDGKVFTERVPEYSKLMLQKLIRGHVATDCVTLSIPGHDYDGLMDFGYEKLFRLEHNAKSVQAPDQDNFATIESFWCLAKRRLIKFHGVPNRTLYLHSKETEFRFNHQHENLYKKLLVLLRNNPI